MRRGKPTCWRRSGCLPAGARSGARATASWWPSARKRRALHLQFYSEEREQEAELTIQNGRRSASLNGVPKRSPAELVGQIPRRAVLPGAPLPHQERPALRRNFIDAALCQVKPAYAPLLSRYHHTLVQRNALLKDIPRHAELLDTLEIWDDRLARYGDAVARERAAYIQKIEAPARELYSGDFGK